MRIVEELELEDPAAVVRRWGFATIVTEDADGLAILSHVARADPFCARLRDGARPGGRDPAR